jgi:hypothetical protein
MRCGAYAGTFVVNGADDGLKNGSQGDRRCHNALPACQGKAKKVRNLAFRAKV